LRDKGLISFDQEKFGNLSTIVAAILIDWHMARSSLSLPLAGRPSHRTGEEVLRFSPDEKVEVQEIDDARESQA
jgi:hypothetical protein